MALVIPIQRCDQLCRRCENQPHSQLHACAPADGPSADLSTRRTLTDRATLLVRGDVDVHSDAQCHETLSSALGASASASASASALLHPSGGQERKTPPSPLKLPAICFTSDPSPGREFRAALGFNSLWRLARAATTTLRRASLRSPSGPESPPPLRSRSRTAPPGSCSAAAFVPSADGVTRNSALAPCSDEALSEDALVDELLENGEGQAPNGGDVWGCQHPAAVTREDDASWEVTGSDVGSTQTTMKVRETVEEEERGVEGEEQIRIAEREDKDEDQGEEEDWPPPLERAAAVRRAATQTCNESAVSVAPVALEFVRPDKCDSVGSSFRQNVQVRRRQQQQQQWQGQRRKQHPDRSHQQLLHHLERQQQQEHELRLLLQQLEGLHQQQLNWRQRRRLLEEDIL